MGALVYGAAAERFEIDDEKLAHVEAVVVAKLRRREDFTITVLTAESRQVLWMHEACTLRFEYDTPPGVELDRAWLDATMKQLNKSSTLVVDTTPAGEAVDADAAVSGRSARP